MRFLVIVKANEASEAGEMPSADLMRQMNAYNEELLAAGVLVDGNGLQPSSTGWKFVREGDDYRMVDGPFAETKELIAGYWVINVKSMDEAVAWLKRAPMDADGHDACVEIRQIFELDDFPVLENESGWRESEQRLRDEWAEASPGPAQGSLPPTPGKLVYMGIVHATPESEAGAMPTEEEIATMGALMEEAAAAGVILGGEGLLPSAQGVRIEYQGGQRSVIDGPFAETKELVGGYALLQYDSEEEAREWTLRFARTSGQQCVQVRPVYRPEDFSEELQEQAADVFEAEERMRRQLNG